MSRLSKALSLLIIGLIVLCAAVGAYLLFAKNIVGVSAATENTTDTVGLVSTRGFIYASHPQRPANDSVLITAQLYKDGQPYKQADVPVDFFLSDSRFATLDNSMGRTDEFGSASTYVRSYASGEIPSSFPFLLNVTAKAEGKSSTLTVMVSRYMTLNGTVADKNGDPVQGAVVSLVYADTRQPVNASGSTTVTDAAGRYRLDMVPTDVGDLIVYAKKGYLEAFMPADFSGTQHINV